MSTVSQLYDSNLDMNNVAYALYNDDPPPPEGTASSTYAHSKGVILTNDKQGFWLIHSKPNWPNARSTGAGPFPDTTYSQSLMCITFNASSFDDIAIGSMINYPYIYDAFISTNLQVMLPNLSLWLSGEKSALLNTTINLTSAGGVNYTQFAKSKAWGKDLYDDFVAPVLETGLNVETWRSGSGGRMSSICEDADDDTWAIHTVPYTILEVSEVTMPDGASWLGTKDHSKWASSIEGRSVCIGDINRMCSQEARGGGTVCITVDDNNLWDSFDAAVTDTEECWQYNPCTSTSQCYWCPIFSPTPAPTEVAVPTISPAPTASHARTVTVGDVAIVLFNSDDADTVTLVALDAVGAGTLLKITDNGWLGSSFRSGEGVVGFSVTSTVPAGHVWSYEGAEITTPYGVWSKLSGSFSLATSGDNIFVYVGDSDSPEFLFGLSTVPWVNSSSDVDTTTSMLPESLSTNTVDASIEFEDVDSGMYNGTVVGSKSDLLVDICSLELWRTSSSTRFHPSSLEDFTVLETTNFPTTSPTLSPTNMLTTLPTASPTVSPTDMLTALPTTPGSFSPSFIPTRYPTSFPTPAPSHVEKKNTSINNDGSSSGHSKMGKTALISVIVAAVLFFPVLFIAWKYINLSDREDEIRSSLVEIP
eukprot:CAMPEP_0185020602 /NCGR_PEP_ID=MMETSP1103-20130426/3215_1 /TAXON_ID=36769 /ORGANISM="Paraphysomonas bandaiensis, Strain Caron Lab Isolate" /LENGTH=645 /DNA_ID=CAMNT_0027551601 /DNA_START=313 /DNA_END=2250 /DNA_ORIENTATION=-